MQTIQIPLRFSRLLLAALALAHLGAGAALLVVPLPFLWQLSCGVAIPASLAYAVWRHGLRRGSRSVIALRISGRGMEVQLASGAWLASRVLDSSLVTPWLTVLHLKPEQHRGMLPLVLLPDMLPPEDFRRLRVWLRWGSVASRGAEGTAML